MFLDSAHILTRHTIGADSPADIRILIQRIPVRYPTLQSYSSHVSGGSVSEGASYAPIMEVVDPNVESVLSGPEPIVSANHNIYRGISTSSQDHTSSSTHVERRARENDHFAGLLKAVTSAAGQEAAGGHTKDGLGQAFKPGPPQHTSREQPFICHLGNTATLDSRGKRERLPSQGTSLNSLKEISSEAESVEAPPFMGSRKRKRRSKMSSAPCKESQEEWHEEGYHEESENGSGSLEIRELAPPISMAEARAAGVHSAIALFRRPSASSKKYTRPPMSKLFTSLELTPENFLHLQAAAKSYMLDSSYPERQECVGSRGRGDTDMVKLRLYNCVKEFLELEGFGERFFGGHIVSEGYPKRKLVWPGQKAKIITLVSPLLRRMVTNERQRQYAVETRSKGSPDSTKNSKKKTKSFQSADSPAPFNGFAERNAGTPHTSRSGPPLDTQQLLSLEKCSFLTKSDWNEFVNLIQQHLDITHTKGAEVCNDECQEHFFEHTIINAQGYLQKSTWGRARSDPPIVKRYKSPSARDVLRATFLALSTKSDMILSPGVETEQLSEYEHQNPTSQVMLSSPQQAKSPVVDGFNFAAAPYQINRSNPMVHLPQAVTPALPHPPDSVLLRLIIMKGSEREPFLRLRLPSCGFPNLSSLLERIKATVLNGPAPWTTSVMQKETQESAAIQALLEGGLTLIPDEESYANTLAAVREASWMEKEVRVLVHFP
ncbi:MAG: hypothetical protein M1829_000742 [Trizodia sp. TS-e1964]|nr:MAG: hypothetical protein M1829_000742 [Trizodia sp. TS-e1964]